MPQLRTTSLSVAIVALACVLSVLVTQQAKAESICIEGAPPAEYRYDPGPYTLVWTAKPWAYCPGARLGCTDDESRTIYVNTSLRYDSGKLACLLAHEEAHLNGWKHAKRSAFAY